MANSQDFALVIGINHYRSLNPLEGAHRDARQFVDWLRSPEGGDLPEENVGIFLSSPSPWAPGLEEIVDWIVALVEERSPALDVRIGRRLYLFMAGHGIGPGVEEAGLLTPTTSALAVKYVAGSRFADFFRGAALFEEVLLFMDCCRDHDWELPEPWLPLKQRVDAAAAHKVRTLYAYATGFGRKAREREIDGEVGGVFTHALIEGLRCAGADADGRITAGSLKRYIERRVAALRVAGTDQVPFVKAPDDFVLRQGCPPPRVRVTIELTDAAYPVVVLDAAAGLTEVAEPIRDEGADRRSIDLIPGRIYVVQVNTNGVMLRQTAIEVKDEGENHVRL